MRQVYLLDLRDKDMAAEYEDWHRPGRVPDGVLDDIRDAGIEAMQIFRCGERLVMVSETCDDRTASNRIGSQASRDWEARMDRFQKPLPLATGGEKWAEAAKIFDLQDHRTSG
nr:L-rhamnose mutarotase [Erythrobacter aureus]